jgi:serine/threonine-protein kinase
MPHIVPAPPPEPTREASPSSSEIRVTLGSETSEAAPALAVAAHAMDNDWGDSEATVVKSMSSVLEAEARAAGVSPTPSRPPIPGNPFFAPLVDNEGRRTPSLLPPPGEAPEAPAPAAHLPAPHALPAPFMPAPSSFHAADHLPPPPSGALPPPPAAARSGVPALPPPPSRAVPPPSTGALPPPPALSRPSGALPHFTPPPRPASLPAAYSPPRAAAAPTPMALASAPDFPTRTGKGKLIALGLAAAAALGIGIVLMNGGKTTPTTATLIAAAKQPGVKLKLDGDDKGTLPVQLKGLTPGEHKLEFSCDEHYSTETQTIQIGPNETRELAPIALKVLRGMATFDVKTPGATLTLVMGDDRKPISAPSQPIDVDTARSPAVEVSKTGFQTLRVPLTFEESANKVFAIDIGPAGGGPVAVAPAPKADPPAAAGGTCTLSFNSIPASRVVLDGRPIGMTPKMDVSVSSGNHSVLFVAPEKSKKMGATCKAGEKKTVIARM